MCILCGINHPKGAPCDFTGADSLLIGKITIHERIEPINEPEPEQELNFEAIPPKKKGRPFAKHNRS